MFTDTVDMLIKLEVNCTAKPMIPLLEQTSHHHIQIIGPPTPPIAIVLVFCMGQFQPGSHVEERANAGQVIRRLLQDRDRQPKLLLSAWTMIAAQQ